MSQEKLQTMVMQTFWLVIEVYYGIVQVVNDCIHFQFFKIKIEVTPLLSDALRMCLFYYSNNHTMPCNSKF